MEGNHGLQLSGHYSLDKDDDAYFASYPTTPNCPTPGQLKYVNHLPHFCQHCMCVCVFSFFSKKIVSIFLFSIGV